MMLRDQCGGGNAQPVSWTSWIVGAIEAGVEVQWRLYSLVW